MENTSNFLIDFPRLALSSATSSPTTLMQWYGVHCVSKDVERNY